jgi:hypothetical protein
MPYAISDDTAEEIAAVAERCANLFGATKLPLPPATHMAAIAPALVQMRDELRRIYVGITSENPWEDEPGE